LEANFCPFCGVRFDPNAEEPPEPFDKQTAEPEVEAPEKQPSERAGIPWESKSDLGLIQRLIRTWSESLFNPVNFFRAMPITPGIGLAFIYGLLFKVIGSIFSIYWQKDAMSNMEQNLQDVPVAFREAFKMLLENPLISSPDTQLLLAPVIGVFALFLSTIIFHLAMMISGGARNGFEATFRVVAYAESTAIFHAIPVVGAWIALVYWLVLLVIGNREAHETSTGHAIAGIVLPIFLCFCFIAISIFIFSPALINSGL
jgi:hypothetical protein